MKMLRGLLIVRLGFEAVGYFSRLAAAMPS